MRNYKDFPEDMNRRAYGIYPRKGLVQVSGFAVYKLKELKKIPLNTRLSFPHDLFVAIDKAK